MKRKLFFILSLLYIGVSTAQTTVNGYHGPYVLYTDSVVLVIGADSSGTTYVHTDDTRPASLLVTSHDGAHRFPVALHRHFSAPLILDAVPETLVVSDLHGNIDAFVDILRGAGVIDLNYNWTYGGNRLIFNGDVLDRGRDDVVIFWLLYKLEEQARKEGGEVVFLIGNHEDLVLKGDLRYIHADHKTLSESVGIPYQELYGADSELGRWIRGKSLMAIDNRILFVHAGLSSRMAEEDYTPGKINALGREFLGMNRKKVEFMDEYASHVFRTDGPLWYRGLVRDDERHPGISDGELNRVLEYYNVDTIVVGHSEVDEVHSRYDGQVVPVNVRHNVNHPANRTAGLLISAGKLYTVDYSGNREPL